MTDESKSATFQEPERSPDEARTNAPRALLPSVRPREGDYMSPPGRGGSPDSLPTAVEQPSCSHTPLAAALAAAGLLNAKGAGL